MQFYNSELIIGSRPNKYSNPIFCLKKCFFLNIGYPQNISVSLAITIIFLQKSSFLAKILSKKWKILKYSIRWTEGFDFYKTDWAKCTYKLTKWFKLIRLVVQPKRHWTPPGLCFSSQDSTKIEKRSIFWTLFDVDPGRSPLLAWSIVHNSCYVVDKKRGNC